MGQSRRSFLKASGTLAAGSAAGGDTDAANPETINTKIAAPKSLPYLRGPMQGAAAGCSMAVPLLLTRRRAAGTQNTNAGPLSPANSAATKEGVRVETGP